MMYSAKNRSVCAGLFFMLLVSAVCAAQVSFSGLDLNMDNRLLFAAEHAAGIDEAYKSLFVYNLDNPVTQSVSPIKPSNPRLLTCYPQSLELLQNGQILQIRNRYGTAHYYTDENRLRWIERPASLAKNPQAFIPVETKRLVPLSVSPDGNWYCAIRKKTAASGDLVLTETATGDTYLLAPGIEYSFEKIPVLWSPDSSILTYEKEGMLYFMNMRNKFSITEIPENCRQIGSGTISCLYWASPKLLVYISNEIVYAISANELFTRALYSDLVGTGRIAGRLANVFNCNADRFWTNADGTAIVMVQGNRTLWYMELNGMDFSFVTTLFSYPFVNIPGTAMNFSVFWTPESSVAKTKQIPLVWIELLGAGSAESYVYKLEKNTVQHNTYFTPLPLPPAVKKPVLSPDAKRLAFTGTRTLHVYDIETWKQSAVFSDEPVVSYVWANPASLYIGGKHTVREWKPFSNTGNVLFLSAADRYAWDGSTGKVIAGTPSGYYLYDESKNVWAATKNNITRKAAVSNQKWRVFIGDSPNVQFANTVYARNLTPMSSNVRLFPETAVRNTAHKPRVAITFDALDSADGVTPALVSLQKYRLRTTFFINGEFLRRFPAATQRIVAAGHECGSMFYTPFPFDSKAYTVDEAFIRRGLARNEDDFFAVTGSELALVWHSPYYLSNRIAVAAGNNAGYRYISDGLAPPDTVTLEEAVAGKAMYYSAAEMIDAIVPQLQNGSVIPVSLGISNGTRSDYLYNKLDLLISAVLEAGYDIVPVSDLHK